MERRTDQHGSVAVVLSGAGARGAFQAGALAELLPELERQRIVPTILLGTSAGSINAALWGSWSHLGADGAGELLTDLWSRMSHADVFGPVAVSMIGTSMRFGQGALLGRGGGTTALLDTAPLRRTARTELDLDGLSVNIEAGHPAAVGVVATRVPAAPDKEEGTASGRSVVFLQERTPSSWTGDPRRAVDVVRCRLGIDHVLASAAIPIAFPAVRVPAPPEAVGWYVDGGVRLNTPLRPAIELGANRLVVISATATVYAEGPLPPDPTLEPPDLADAGAQAVHAVLADRLVEDLHRLGRRNEQVRENARTPAGRRTMPTDPSGRPYRAIDYLTVSPEPGEMGRLADEVYRTKIAGRKSLDERDLGLIGKLLRGAGDAAGRRELLSYLLFDEDYFRQSIELGRKAARAALSAGWAS